MLYKIVGMSIVLRVGHGIVGVIWHYDLNWQIFQCHNNVHYLSIYLPIYSGREITIIMPQSASCRCLELKLLLSCIFLETFINLIFNCSKCQVFVRFTSYFQVNKTCIFLLTYFCIFGLNNMNCYSFCLWLHSRSHRSYVESSKQKLWNVNKALTS